MTDTAEIVSRLRCQSIEVAHCAADAIENLVVSEAEARKTLDEVLKQYTALLAHLQLRENGQWTPRKIVRAG
jgi:hypothetical protein